MKRLLSLFLLLNLTACQSAGEDVEAMIMVTQPQNNEAVSCPLHVEGQARGYWYFEASFPILLRDKDGTLLAATLATAKSEWTTDDFVAFEADLYYEIDTNQEATLVLKKDNPSGLPEDEKELDLSIQLTPCTPTVLENYRHNLVENYIRTNIGELSPVAPVLGGSWYVLSVEFLEGDKVSVFYEDGHIQEHFEATFLVDEWGNVNLSF